MRTIIIEDTVYQVRDKQYKAIEVERTKVDDSTVSQINFWDYLMDTKDQYKLIGLVEFDWRL